jgi:outer membrane protein assembly factor BamB
VIRTIQLNVSSMLLDSPDGLVYVVTGSSETGSKVEVHDVTTGVKTREFALPRYGIYTDNAVSADGRTAVFISGTTTSSPATLVAIDTATGAVRQDIALPAFDPVGGVELAHDGDKAYVWSLSGDFLQVSLTTGKKRQLAAAWRATLSVDGRELYAIGDGVLYTLNADTGDQIRKVSAPPLSGHMLARPDGRLIITGAERESPQESTISMIDPGTGEVIATTRAREIFDAAISPEGTQLYLLPIRATSGDVDVISIMER